MGWILGHNVWDSLGMVSVNLLAHRIKEPLPLKSMIWKVGKLRLLGWAYICSQIYKGMSLVTQSQIDLFQYILTRNSRTHTHTRPWRLLHFSININFHCLDKSNSFPMTLLLKKKCHIFWCCLLTNCLKIHFCITAKHAICPVPNICILPLWCERVYFSPVYCQSVCLFLFLIDHKKDL